LQLALGLPLSLNHEAQKNTSQGRCFTSIESILAAYASASAFLATGTRLFWVGLANRVLPNEPLKILPFLVFLSPRPMVVTNFLERQI
jgi:hypothetical protein